MSKLEELRNMRASIDGQIKKEEERVLREKEGSVLDKIHSLSDEQISTMLSFLQHSRSSCSDENPCNGLSYIAEEWRCEKCMLMEILRGSHGGRYDFRFDVDISKVSV